jgi:hypothetical protein
MLTIAQNLLGLSGGNYWNIEKIKRQPNMTSLAPSMYSLVLNGKRISVSMVMLVARCQLFQARPELLSKPYNVESGVSLDSLRVLLDALDGVVVEISDANVRDLSLLCDEFKFTALAKTVGDWQAQRPPIDAGVRRELDLVQARLDERL